jgi:hypothetical protein
MTWWHLHTPACVCAALTVAAASPHQRGAVRNPDVRALLASWARQDFKLEESGPADESGE